MGNGALPNGLSYRAHPRLYRNRPGAMSALQPLLGGKRTHCGHVAIAVFDPLPTFGLTNCSLRKWTLNPISPVANPCCNRLIESLSVLALSLGEAMRRRDFITLLGGAAVAVPVGARAQQAGMPVIGFLNSGSLDSYMSQVKAFHQALKETGYVEGQNVAIEYRWAENQIDRLSALADDLVRRKVLVAAGGAQPPHWQQNRRPQQFQLSS
jgi:hypothetical protein